MSSNISQISITLSLTGDLSFDRVMRGPFVISRIDTKAS